MDKRSFLKGIFGIGVTAAVSTLPTPVKAKITNGEIDSPNLVNDKQYDTINALNWKMYNAFTKNDASLVTESDYIKLANEGDKYLSTLPKDDIIGDVILERIVFAKIKYHLVNKNILYADGVFSDYSYRFLPSSKYNYAAICKEYANHLLYAGYILKAKTQMSHFKMYCHPNALQKLQDKKIWNSVENDWYAGGYKFRDNQSSHIAYLFKIPIR
jgi:hypothetical protein